MTRPALAKLQACVSALLCFALCLSSFPAQALATALSTLSQTSGTTALSSANLDLEGAYSPVLQRALSLSEEFEECRSADGFQNTPYYTLFDLTHDSIPELFVYHGANQQTMRWYVFTIQDGRAAFLGKVEGLFLYSLCSVTDRLYANSWHANAGSILSLSYSDGRLQTSVVREQTTDSQSLADYLYDIGAEALSKPLATDVSLLRTVSDAYAAYGRALDQYLETLCDIERDPSSILDEGYDKTHPYVNLIPFVEGTERVDYACIDLNGDTIPELLLGGKSEYGYERADFLSHVIAYSRGELRDAHIESCYRSWGYLSERGEIVSRGSSGVHDGEIAARSISSSGESRVDRSISWTSADMVNHTTLELTRTTNGTASSSIIPVGDLGAVIDDFMAGYQLRSDIAWMPIEAVTGGSDDPSQELPDPEPSLTLADYTFSWMRVTDPQYQQLVKDANYPSWIIAASLGPTLINGSVDAMENCIFRGLEGFGNQFTGSLRVEDTEKLLVALLDYESPQVEALAYAQTATQIGGGLAALLEIYVANSQINSADAKRLIDCLGEEEFAQIIFNRSFDTIVSDTAKKLNVSEDSKIVATLTGFLSSKKVLETLSDGLGFLGTGLRLLSISGKAMDAYYEVLSLANANDCYITMLEYLRDNSTSDYVRKAAANVLSRTGKGIESAYQALGETLAEEGASWGVETGVGAIFNAIGNSGSLPYTAAISLGFTAGVSISNVLFNTAGVAETEEHLLNAILLCDALTSWTIDARTDFLNAYSSDSPDSNEAAACVLYSVDMLLQARKLSEKALQAFAKVQIKLTPNQVRCYRAQFDHAQSTLVRLEGFEEVLFSNETLINVTEDALQSYSVLISCPVDVAILDSHGYQVAVTRDGSKYSWTNGALSYEVTPRLEDGGWAKILTIPKDRGYSLEIRARDAGSVDCTILDADEDGQLLGLFATDVEVASGTTIVVSDLDPHGTGMYKVDGVAQRFELRESGSRFSDVNDPEAWFYDAVMWAASYGYVEGYGDGRFGPFDTLTRAQAAMILWRYFSPDEAASYVAGGTPNLTGMPDVRAGEWYTGAANWAVSNGVINGAEHPDGSRTFEPDGIITREQLCAIIGNAAERYRGSSMSGADLGKLESMPDASSVSPWATEAVAWSLNNGVINGAAAYDPAGNEIRYVDPGSGVDRAAMATVLKNVIEAGVL